MSEAILQGGKKNPLPQQYAITEANMLTLWHYLGT